MLLCAGFFFLLFYCFASVSGSECLFFHFALGPRAQCTIRLPPHSLSKCPGTNDDCCLACRLIRCTRMLDMCYNAHIRGIYMSAMYEEFFVVFVFLYSFDVVIIIIITQQR